MVSVADFMPISLCSMGYKFFAKLVGTRLASLLPKLVSLSQGVFVRGRLIFDNI